MRWKDAKLNTRRILVGKPEGTELISRREWGIILKMYQHIYTYNSTIIRYNDIPTCGKPITRFGIFRLSSEKYATKENTIIAGFVVDM